MPALFAQLVFAVVLLGLCFAVFGGLGRLFACNPAQKLFFSKSIGLDLWYCALGILYAGVGPALVAAAGFTPWRIGALPGLGAWAASVPAGVQLLLLLIATDFCQYWLHRALHTRQLWPFHAIHHSAEEVNWTTTYRVHPLNYLVQTTSVAALAKLAGFSDISFLLAGPILFFSGALSHANLNWTYGPLRFVITSPVFHRWHHADEMQHRDTNFAPMFPLWDLAFGTFHMPRGVLPQSFGAPGVPTGLVGQLAHPFRPEAWGGASSASPSR